VRPRLARAGVLGVGIALVSLLVPPDARAVNTLSNGVVSPSSGSTLTTFVFTVDYFSNNGQEATSVRALVGDEVVALSLVDGDANDGTFSGSSTLPAGSWPVTFEAFSQGQDPTLAGPTVVVIGPTPQPTPTSAPTPTPTARPRPTPRVSPRPTPAATAAPTATPNPPRSTPRPAARATPRPTPASAVPTAPTAPAATATATATGSGSPSADPSATPGGTPLPGIATATPAPTSGEGAIVPTPTDGSQPGREAPGIGAGRGPLLVLGGGLAAGGFAVLAVQLGRRRRRPTLEQP
jgi:hypothetical protein